MAWDPGFGWVILDDGESGGIEHTNGVASFVGYVADCGVEVFTVFAEMDF